MLQPKVMVGAPHQWLVVGPYALTGRVFLPRSRERNSQQDGWSTPGRDHFWGEWKDKSIVTLLTTIHGDELVNTEEGPKEPQGNKK